MPKNTRNFVISSDSEKSHEAEQVTFATKTAKNTGSVALDFSLSLEMTKKGMFLGFKSKNAKFYVGFQINKLKIMSICDNKNLYASAIPYFQPLQHKLLIKPIIATQNSSKL